MLERLSPQFAGEKPVHTAGIMWTGARIGAIGDWPPQNTPGKDGAARFEAADLGFNSNFAEFVWGANGTAGVTVREDDHASRMASRLPGMRHDPSLKPAQRGLESEVPRPQQINAAVAAKAHLSGSGVLRDSTRGPIVLHAAWITLGPWER
jgi:hypothetical protein